MSGNLLNNDNKTIIYLKKENFKAQTRLDGFSSNVTKNNYSRRYMKGNQYIFKRVYLLKTYPKIYLVVCMLVHYISTIQFSRTHHGIMAFRPNTRSHMI